MALIAFKADENLKDTLGRLAKIKGISLSSLVKLYVNKELTQELSQLTENNMTLGEELEILKAEEEGGDGIVYDDVESLIASLHDKNWAQQKIPQTGGMFATQTTSTVV